MKLSIRWASLLFLLSVVHTATGQSVEADKEKSVKPNINDRFVDDELKIEDWLKRFEVESREVFAARDEIIRACRIKSGFRIADVGAGTGLFTRLMSKAVGDSGWIYAIDISPKFLQHINSNCTEKNIKNVTCILCSDRSIGLPASSVDVVFV
ncbi:MAG: class I SAM-dependent methyltransferase, partial [Planctomycetota bacterium]